MKFRKIASAQQLLRSLAEKSAGVMLPLAVGATAVGGYHTIRKGLQKGREYKQGFEPGHIPQEH